MKGSHWAQKQGIINEFLGEEGQLERDCEERIDRTWRTTVVVIDDGEKELKNDF